LICKSLSLSSNSFFIAPRPSTVSTTFFWKSATIPASAASFRTASSKNAAMISLFSFSGNIFR